MEKVVYKYLPADNTNTFRILHLIYGILLLVFSMIGVFYAILGTFISTKMETEMSGSELDSLPFNPFNFFTIIGIVLFIWMATLGILNLFSAKYFKEKRKHQFIFINAILNIFTGVFGIILAIFTLIEINKPHVKNLFNGQEIGGGEEIE